MVSPIWSRFFHLLLGDLCWMCACMCASLLLMLRSCCSELRERIQPEILELIKQQRLNRLCEGSCFRKLGNRRRQGRNRSPPMFYPLLMLCCTVNPASFPSAFFFLLSLLEKFWFCRLSLNHKVLHYGDLDESPQGEVPFELLSDKSKMLHNSRPRCT